MFVKKSFIVDKKQTEKWSWGRLNNQKNPMPAHTHQHTTITKFNSSGDTTEYVGSCEAVTGRHNRICREM